MSVSYVSELIQSSFWNYWGEHDEAVKALKKKLIEEALDAERSELIGCKPYERSTERQDERNGYWKRWITLYLYLFLDGIALFLFIVLRR